MGQPNYRRPVYDRYGNLLRDGLDAIGYVCEKSKTKTTFEVELQTNDGQSVRAIFKNVSLVPGKDFDLEIATSNERVTPAP